MNLDSLDAFTKFTKNRYEAIMVAAKHARKMNELLEKAEAASSEEEESDKLKVEKMVNKALREVLEGKVKFERPKTAGRKFTR